MARFLTTFWRREPRLGPARRDVLLAFTIGLALYGIGIDEPRFAFIDETVYCHAAQNLIAAPAPIPAIPSPWDELPENYEHPPLGKLWMWASSSLLDAPRVAEARPPDDAPAPPTGALVACRVPSVIAGAATGATILVLAYLLFNDRFIAWAAAFCWWIDNLAYVGSTYAMLDVLAVAFLTGAYAAALNPQRSTSAVAALFGLAVATKLSALLGGLFLPYLVWRNMGPRSFADRCRTVASLVAVSLVVFVATYLPYIAAWSKIHGIFGMVPRLLVAWKGLLLYHSGSGLFLGLNPGPATWMLFGRPVLRESYSIDGTNHVIVAATIGNQLLWYFAWAAALAFLATLLLRRLRRQPRPRSAAIEEARFRMAVWFLLAAAIPYFFLSRKSYQYYAIGFLPFLDLVAAIAIGVTLRSTRFRLWSVPIVAAAVIVFLARLPLVEGLPVPRWYADFVLP